MWFRYLIRWFWYYRHDDYLTRTYDRLRLK
jgi:hypothetical protein